MRRIIIGKPSDPPLVQASAIAFVDYTPGSGVMNVTWKPGSGRYAMLVVRQATVVSRTPVDGVYYTPNSVFGDGDVVGSATQYCCFIGENAVDGMYATVSGLTVGVSYNFWICGFQSLDTLLYNKATGILNPRSIIIP